MSQPLLTIENLSVGFRNQQTVRTVVNDISLQVAAGETLALVGNQVLGKVLLLCQYCGCYPLLLLNIWPEIFDFMVNHCFMPVSRNYVVCVVTRSP